MGEAPRLLQHWKAKRGGRECGVFLFTDGIAIVPQSLSREQEILQALNASPTASPQTILGSASWWFPFDSIRRLIIVREKAEFTVRSSVGTASGFMATVADMDYFLELMRDFCKAVTWKERPGKLRFANDNVRLVLSSLVLVSLGFALAVLVNLTDHELGGELVFFARWLNAAGLAGLGKWAVVGISAAPTVILFLLILIRALLSPRYTIYEPVA